MTSCNHFWPAYPCAWLSSVGSERPTGAGYRSRWGFPKIRGTLFGGPHNKDYSILGSILGSPYFGKLPYGCFTFVARRCLISDGLVKKQQTDQREQSH